MQPTLESTRLCLRPFDVTDAGAVQRLAGDERVARAAAAIPHPYPEGEAERWISTHGEAFAARREVVFAVTLHERNELVGAISLFDLGEPHARGELGYWTGVEHWNRGYCTEAAARLIRYAHEELGVTKIVARCSAENLASSRVMTKLGMKREGLLAKHALKHGRFVDMLVYGLVLPGRGA
ncbi:MAG: GNAT family N-acetyltransferase [Burkholderiales bacterium]